MKQYKIGVYGGKFLPFHKGHKYCVDIAARAMVTGFMTGAVGNIVLHTYEFYLVVVVASALIYHAVLVKIGGEVAWFDAFTLSIGILATILELLRYREQYVWWIITDIVSIGMYIAHFDAVYLTKRSIYLIMAVIGLINWAKLNRTRNAENE